jgi:acylphosphatase
MTGEIIARRCRVRGRVQGVFYRGSTARRANELGVAGSARNMPDGSVEVLAVGTEAAVNTLIQWLWIGPSAAHVIAVDVEPLTAEQAGRPRGFTTG